MKDLDVTELVIELNGRLFISKKHLNEYLNDTEYEFDNELGMLGGTDLSEWVSPNKEYNFDSSNCNDPECGSPCLSKILFQCVPVSNIYFEFSATQITTDPYRNQPYHCIDLIRDGISGCAIEISNSTDSPSSVRFVVSKIDFPEFRQAVVDALIEHINMYYWCDQHTCRGFYCDHFEEHEKI